MEARAAIKVDEKWRWEILIRLIEREQSSKIGQRFLELFTGARFGDTAAGSEQLLPLIK
jgi:hypothetical protein